jgi:glutathione S-transferase
MAGDRLEVPNAEDAVALKLIIGNKNYSSWSFRPWIAMKGAGIGFEEELIPFGQPLGNLEFKSQVQRYSPAGRVPVLADGDLYVWDSLAILEYLAEIRPDAHLWPTDAKARAHARAISNEMHAGFQALRNECPMNFRRPVRARDLSADARANILRIEAMWADCHQRYGGPFLFGRFGAADAMYAPVVSRFQTYAVSVAAETLTYMEAMMALPAWASWKNAALDESWIVAEDEIDWPTVL